jgi:predicted  nucleic acid-binding Zn-ribbon protein
MMGSSSQDHQPMEGRSKLLKAELEGRKRKYDHVLDKKENKKWKLNSEYETLKDKYVKLEKKCASQDLKIQRLENNILKPKSEEGQFPVG